MDFILKFLRLFILSDTEREIVNYELGIENIRRILYFCIITIPTSAIHIVIFSLKLDETIGIEYQWSLGILISHSVITFFSILISALLYFFAYRKGEYNFLAKICVNFLIILILSAGGIIAATDQLITSSITPFLVTSLIISVVAIIQPLKSIIFYGYTYLIFFFALRITEQNSDVLISNQVNGLTISALCLSLSIILWKGHLTRIIQSKLIEKQNLELFESNQTKDKFFSIIAHDLKSPFNAILGFSNLLYDDLKTNNTEKLQKHIENINISANNTYKLLENLLEWSMNQTGRMQFNPEKIDLSDIILEKIDEFSIIAKPKNISLNHIRNVDISIFADKNMLNTIFRNLISNAIKYTRIGGRIDILVLQKATELEVTVADNGVGITDEIKNQLFQLNTSISVEGTSKEKGTGLGLMLTKEFVLKHGGEIHAESETGEGSRFVFTLPLK